MAMQAFRLEGNFRMAPTRWQRFRREIAALSEAAARERLLSELGSKHGVERRYITIEKVAELKAEEVTSPIVRAVLAGGEE